MTEGTSGEKTVTEAEWLACTDPIEMIEFLRGNPTSEDTVTWWNNRWRTEEPSKGNDRKFRLFACACCRRIWKHIPEACNREAVIAVEEFTDGRLAGSALTAALQASSAVEYREDGSKRPEPGYWIVKYLGRGFYKMTAAASALLVASQGIFMVDEEYGREAGHEFSCCYYTAAGYFMRPFRWPLPLPVVVEVERTTQADLLRCIFGNPFRPVSLAPAVLTWNDSIVVRLAQTAYEERHLPAGTLDDSRLAVLADALEEAGCTDAEILSHLRSPGPHVRGCWPVDLCLGKS
jgi:hypothetical protein